MSDDSFEGKTDGRKKSRSSVTILTELRESGDSINQAVKFLKYFNNAKEKIAIMSELLTDDAREQVIKQVNLELFE